MALGIVNKKYVSSIDFLDQREILNQALDVQNEDVTFIDVMELTKRSVVTSVPKYHNFVNEELYKLGEVASTSGTGTSITINLTSDTAGTCKAGDIIGFNDGNQGYIQKKESAKLTVLSVDGTSINGSVAVGDKLSFFTFAGGEGSKGPEPERWGYQKYANQVQIFKGKVKITDIQKVSKVEVQFNGQPYYFIKNQHDALRKFRANIAFAMLMQKGSAYNFAGQDSGTPTLTDEDGNPVQTTKGLNPCIEDDGIVHNLDGSTVALSDLKTLTTSLDLMRAPFEYEMFVGTLMNQQIEDWAHSLGNGEFLSDAARYMITQNLDLGIKSFKLYGRRYFKINMPMLDHDQVTHYEGAPDLYKSAFLVPRGKIKTEDGDMIDRLRVRYMAGDGTNLRYRETLTGGLAPKPTNDESYLGITYESVQGLDALGLNFFGKIAPAAGT